MLLQADYAAAFECEASTSELSEWRDAATKDEPTMQVKVHPKGEWHEMLIDRTRTKCGKPLGAYATRDATYAGRLCEDGCFSPYELNLARQLREQEEREAREDQQRIQDAAGDDSQLVRDIAEGKLIHRRRLDTATGKHLKLDPEEE